jgi:N-acetylneuraminic acid mutarotase
MLHLSRILRLRLPLVAGLIAFTSFTINAQTSFQASPLNEWTWMGGTDTTLQWGNNTNPFPGDSGVFGTMGVPAVGNIPGALYGAATWVDNNGNFWLFGGVGFDANGNQGYLNNLWEYTPSTNEWEWVGPSTSKWVGIWKGNGGDLDEYVPGWYGTLGVPGPYNFPGSRTGALTWTDKNGNLWLFGGNNGINTDPYGDLQGYFNDIWEFNPSTREWAWIGGSSTGNQTGVYGTLGTPVAENIPPARTNASSWTDSDGNLWLFGGVETYQDPNNTSNLYDIISESFCDLWKYNPSTNEWAWMDGSSNWCVLSNGTPDPRFNASSWTDENGNFWLFAGLEGSDDLWEFSPSTNEWAWIGGGCQGGNYANCGGYEFGVYGTLGTPAAGNLPGQRYSAASWTDTNGNIWLFGGEGEDANDNSGDLNDLWEFNPSTQEWAWISGLSALPNCILNYSGYPVCDNAPGVFGSVGIPAAVNAPRGRDQAASWTDSSGNLWLFGGELSNQTYDTYFIFNDMWKFQLALTNPTVTVTPASFSILPMQSLSVTIAASGTPTPTGSVTLSGGGYTSAAATLSGGSATISIAAGSLAVGSDTLTASYTPDANSSSTYNSATGTSGAVTVTLSNPAPAIGSLSPAFTSADGAAFTLTVNGTDFTANSTVNWGATALTTTYVSATQLTAPVAASEIASAGTSQVTVVTPAPGGGTSNALTFEIDSSDSTGTPPSFSVATVAVAAGSPASYTVTLPSTVTAATASCLNLPTGASCSYSAGTVTITTSASTPKGTYQIIVVFTETVTESASAWILLPILLLPLYFARKRLTRRGAWLSACVVLVLLTATATIIGCGGGGSSTTNQQPPPQTYQVMSSGTVTLTVQ